MLIDLSYIYILILHKSLPERGRGYCSGYSTFLSSAGSFQPSLLAAQPSEEHPLTRLTTPKPRFQRPASSSCWTESLKSVSTVRREKNGYEDICRRPGLLCSFTLGAIHGKGYDQEGIQNTSLIYYLFIAEPINFTSAMKDVEVRERIIILSLIIPPN